MRRATPPRAPASPSRTIRNWRKLPVFQETLADARRDFFSACRSHLNAPLAVAFRSVLQTASGLWSESHRLKASVFLLDRIGHGEISALEPPENNSIPIESIT